LDNAVTVANLDGCLSVVGDGGVLVDGGAGGLAGGDSGVVALAGLGQGNDFCARLIALRVGDIASTNGDSGTRAKVERPDDGRDRQHGDRDAGVLPGRGPGFGEDHRFALMPRNEASRRCPSGDARKPRTSTETPPFGRKRA